MYAIRRCLVSKPIVTWKLSYSLPARLTEEMEANGVSLLILISECVRVTTGNECAVSCALFPHKSDCTAKIAVANFRSCIGKFPPRIVGSKCIGCVWCAMFYNNQLLLLTTLAFFYMCQASELVLYDLNAFPYARCLDGSPSGYYLRPATSNLTASKFLVILEGGGMCTGREDCTARSCFYLYQYKVLFLGKFRTYLTSFTKLHARVQPKIFTVVHTLKKTKRMRMDSPPPK